MAYIVGFLSQKGGVGKSTLARLLAREIAAAGESVKIADLDIQQGTSFEWMERRAKNGVEPEVQVQTFAKVQTALSEAERFYVYIIDGAPHASEMTATVAKAADMIVLPVGVGYDDLNPSIRLAHELVRSKAIEPGRILFVPMRVPDSESELERARQYVQDAGYTVTEGAIPLRTAFSQAMDEGKALSEVSHPSLRGKVETVAQSIIDFMAAMNERKVA